MLVTEQDAERQLRRACADFVTRVHKGDVAPDVLDDIKRVHPLVRPGDDFELAHSLNRLASLTVTEPALLERTDLRNAAMDRVLDVYRTLAMRELRRRAA